MGPGGGCGGAFRFPRSIAPRESVAGRVAETFRPRWWATLTLTLTLSLLLRDDRVVGRMADPVAIAVAVAAAAGGGGAVLGLTMSPSPRLVVSLQQSVPAAKVPGQQLQGQPRGGDEGPRALLAAGVAHGQAHHAQVAGLHVPRATHQVQDVGGQ